MRRTKVVNIEDRTDVHTGIDSKSRLKVAQALSEMLASSVTLYTKSLFYHWNVTGPNFVGLHSLFEQHYNELQAANDTIAERIRALGHFTPGTSKEFASLTKVKEDRSLPRKSAEMVKNLMTSHEICARHARTVQELAQDSKDEGTADLMIERMQYHEKAAWMLRALTE